MTKLNVTTERMEATLATLLLVYVESGRRIPDLERDLEDGAVIAIRSLIADYPKLKAKYDALRGMVEEWKKSATKHENLVNLKAVRALLREIRGFGEEEK